MASVMRFDEWQDSNGVPVLDGANLAIPSSALPTGSILQVVSTTKTDTFTTTNNTLTNITGLSATITPSSASNKIVACLTIGAVDTNGGARVKGGDVTRDGTPIGVGGSGVSVGWLITTAVDNRPQVVSWEFLDSPATTSAVTYQARVRGENSGELTYINRNLANTWSAVSTITLMEVAG